MSTEKVGLYFDSRMSRPWVVRWFGDSSERGSPRRYSKAFKLKRDAENFQREKQREFDDGLRRDKVNITLLELCDRFTKSKVHKHRIQTRNIYRETITQLIEYFGADCSIQRINCERAEQFIGSRTIVHPDHARTGKELSAWGRNRHVRSAAAIFNKAIEWEYLKGNPFSGLEDRNPDKREWHHITPAEFKALLDIVADERIQAFYAVMYGCGLRYGEAVNLLWNGRDIDFERGRINITNRPGTAVMPSFLIKDHEVRSLPIPQRINDMLVQLQAESPEGCPFVYLTPQRWEIVRRKWSAMYKEGRKNEWENRHMANNVLKQFKRYCRRAGIPDDEKLTLHCLRKSFAQNLADVGTPAPTLKRLMGHASIRTTEEFYLRSSDANELKACLAIDSMLSEKTTDVKMTFSGGNTDENNQGEIHNSIY